MTALFSKTAKQKNGEPVRHKAASAPLLLYSVLPQIFRSSFVMVRGSTAKYSTAPTMMIRMTDRIP